MSEIDIEALRALTPGCSQRTHLNNAGAALLSTPTITRMADYLHREAQIGGYEAADEAADEIAAVYESLAELVGASPPQIALFDLPGAVMARVQLGNPCRIHVESNDRNARSSK